MSGFYVFYQGKEPVSIEPDADSQLATVVFENGERQTVNYAGVEIKEEEHE